MSTAITRLTDRIDAALSAPWQMRAMAIVDAIVLNVVILTAARLATGEYPVATVGGEDQTIGFASEIGITVLAGLAAWGLLERMTSRAATVWTAIAMAVFLVSLLGPLGSGADTASMVVLALLHTGAAATIIPLMRRSGGIHTNSG